MAATAQEGDTISIEDALIDGDYVRWWSSETAYEPSFTVEVHDKDYNSTELKKGTDYTVSYQYFKGYDDDSNKLVETVDGISVAGTYYITFTGIGAYSGTKEYGVEVYDKGDINASLGSTPFCWPSATAYKPTTTLEYPNDAGTEFDKTLKLGTDYQITSIVYEGTALDQEKKVPGITKAGFYEITLSGKGAYTGNYTLTELVKTPKISSIANQTYTGGAIKPKIKITDDGWGGVAESKYYTVSYKNNTKAGTATVTIKGKGDYQGTVTKTFKIVQAANTVKAAKTSVSKSFTANKKTKKLAKAQTVALPKVTAKFGTAKWSVSAKDKKGALSLKNGKVQVKKGAKRGTYTIKLKAGVTKTSNYKAAASKVVTVKVMVK